MTLQEAVDSHAARVRDAVGAFGLAIESQALEISESSLARLLGFGGDREVFREVDSIVGEEIASSLYRPTLSSFVEEMAGQVKEFSGMLEAVPQLGDLPAYSITDADREELVLQASLSLATLDSHEAQVMHHVRRAASTLAGDQDLAKLARGISEGIRRLTKVVPIALDQLMIFFRNVGRLYYQSLEGRIDARYSYVGPGGASRDFCRGLINLGGSYTLGEISLLDNGHESSPLIFGGGYGCLHHWVVAVP